MDGLTKVEETAAASAMPPRALRNIALLATCQALTQSSNTLMFASSALAAPADDDGLSFSFAIRAADLTGRFRAWISDAAIQSLADSEPPEVETNPPPV